MQNYYFQRGTAEEDDGGKLAMMGIWQVTGAQFMSFKTRLPCFYLLTPIWAR